MFVCFVEKLYFCKRKIKKTQTMNLSNQYFYGYYFYFAGNCEAVGRM
jgi:hypothetical protein